MMKNPGAEMKSKELESAEHDLKREESSKSRKEDMKSHLEAGPADGFGSKGLMGDMGHAKRHLEMDHDCKH